MSANAESLYANAHEDQRTRLAGDGDGATWPPWCCTVHNPRRFLPDSNVSAFQTNAISDEEYDAHNIEPWRLCRRVHVPQDQCLGCDLKMASIPPRSPLRFPPSALTQIARTSGDRLTTLSDSQSSILHPSLCLLLIPASRPVVADTRWGTADCRPINTPRHATFDTSKLKKSNKSVTRLLNAVPDRGDAQSRTATYPPGCECAHSRDRLLDGAAPHLQGVQRRAADPQQGVHSLKKQPRLDVIPVCRSHRDRGDAQ